MRQQLDELIHQAISHNSDYSLHSMANKEAYTTTLYTLRLYLIENPHNHRTIIYNKGQQPKLPTPDDLTQYIITTIQSLIKKPPTPDESVNRVMSFLVYHLNQIGVTHDGT